MSLKYEPYSVPAAASRNMRGWVKLKGSSSRLRRPLSVSEQAQVVPAVIRLHLIEVINYVYGRH